MCQIDQQQLLLGKYVFICLYSHPWTILSFQIWLTCKCSLSAMPLPGISSSWTVLLACDGFWRDLAFQEKLVNVAIKSYLTHTNALLFVMCATSACESCEWCIESLKYCNCNDSLLCWVWVTHATYNPFEGLHGQYLVFLGHTELLAVRNGWFGEGGRYCLLSRGVFCLTNQQTSTQPSRVSEHGQNGHTKACPMGHWSVRFWCMNRVGAGAEIFKTATMLWEGAQLSSMAAQILSVNTNSLSCIKHPCIYLLCAAGLILRKSILWRCLQVQHHLHTVYDLRYCTKYRIACMILYVAFLYFWHRKHNMSTESGSLRFNKNPT